MPSVLIHRSFKVAKCCIFSFHIIYHNMNIMPLSDENVNPADRNAAVSL